MSRRASIAANLDWLSIFLYVVLVFMGWASVYATGHEEGQEGIFNFTKEYGKQLCWILAAFVLGFLILLVDTKFFTAFSLVIYGSAMLLLLGVLFFGKEVNASRSWFEIGSIRVQPSEFAKFATALALARVMSRHEFKVMRFGNLLLLGLLLAIPAGLIKLQNDTGSAMVYGAFLLVFFREGLHGSILLLCFLAVALFILSIVSAPFTVLCVIIVITLVATCYYRNAREALSFFAALVACFLLLHLGNLLLDAPFERDKVLLAAYLLCSVASLFFIFSKRLKRLAVLLLLSWLCVGYTVSVDRIFDSLLPHQQHRINILLGIEEETRKNGYHVMQSKIAIGSGGLTGKGFLQGTQIKYNFVPAKSTDFIFCAVGEEWGFVGSTVVILLFMTFILRVIYLAERQRSRFSRVYGYCVASILFFHVAVNIGMTIGLVPVIGIPLPFFSYGGSSLWAFSILIFIFLRLDANRLQVFR
ncbi:MAG: rod shape-determining protein RodA [Odoribacteraceae bacterium]|jgi:rod shape determining protein RodA|nr:rod shape-determining protein RodA [Odoribacteraceae bacterium]